MGLIHLHSHSTYSFLDGFGTPGQIVARITDLGFKAHAITDHGNTFGHAAYEKATKATGIKPIFGCEFYIVDDMYAKTRENKSLGADGAPHVTILAMTQKGYQNLIALSTMSWRDGYYYKPRIDWNVLAKHQEGLCVLSGCVGGYPSQIILNKDASAAHKFIDQRSREIEHYYVELIPEPGLSISHDTMPVLMDIARDLNVPWVMTSDAHFPRPEDYIAEDTMVCIGMNVRMNDPKRTIKLPEYQYICTEAELMARAELVMAGHRYNKDELQEAIDNSEVLSDMCNVEIPRAAPIQYNCGGIDPADMLWRWVLEGIQYRLGTGKLPLPKYQEYFDRAEMEFALLKEKKFCDYILCLTDLCRWAKAQDTLVMCRGSAGGCLLLWLLGCSETDSILLDLDFNRFMDITRNDPPDIDVDFEISMKDKVYAYLSEKYGSDCVCQILALSLIRARVAVQDVAAVHGIPREEYSPLSSALDSKDDDVDKQLSGLVDPTALAVLEKYPIFRIIDGLVGQARQHTIHAAGVLISSQPLHQQIAIVEQPGKPRVSSVDKHGAAQLDFLKLDLLVVSAYDVLADAVRRIGANMAWLYSLAYDDPAVFKLAQTGKVAGVFQLDGAAIQIGHQIHLDEFEELIAASALCRPGAVEHVPTYKKNKFDPSAFAKHMASIHPIARRNVDKTYGILIYQEQVMRMCNQMGNMPMSMVHKLRKRIASASFHGFALGPEYGDTFYAGCVANGVSKSEADYWWHAIRAHGIYSFNRAHAATYAIVGYWMLYMKAHYPDAYYESYLAHEGASNTPSQLLMKRLIREYRSTGGEVRMVDPTCSKSTFYSPRKGLIVGGWNNVDGIGKKLADIILSRGPYTSWQHVQHVLPPNIYYKFHEAGVTGVMPYDQHGITEMAPWMPVLYTGEEERAARLSRGFKQPGDLPQDCALNGDMSIAGYLTAIQKKPRTGQFKGEQIIYVLEDETGAIEFRVSSRNTKLAAQVKAMVKRGDYMAISGWWAGNVMFIKQFGIIKRRL